MSAIALFRRNFRATRSPVSWCSPTRTSPKPPLPRNSHTCERGWRCHEMRAAQSDRNPYHANRMCEAFGRPELPKERSSPDRIEIDSDLDETRFRLLMGRGSKCTCSRVLESPCLDDTGYSLTRASDERRPQYDPPRWGLAEVEPCLWLATSRRRQRMGLHTLYAPTTAGRPDGDPLLHTPPSTERGAT